MRLLGVLALATATLTACAGRSVVPSRPGATSVATVTPGPSNVATLQDLLGPWQPTPFALDATWRDAIETACRQDLQQPGMAGGIVDARGGGVVTVRLTGSGWARCDALRVTPEGRVEGAGAGAGGREAGEPPEPPVHIGLIEEAFIGGGRLTITGWSVTGPVSADVVRVEVVTELYPAITATLENGWFSAWWPAPAGDGRPDRLVMAPYGVRAFDADGDLLAERGDPD